MSVPSFDVKDIFSWPVKFRQYIAYEGAEDRWCDFLRASCDSRFSNRIDQALIDKVLDIDKSWSENEKSFVELFLPSFSRVQVLKQVLSLKPNTGETLSDYAARFQTFGRLLAMSDMDISSWVLAETVPLSLPEYIQREVKRLDPHSKQYDKFEDVLTLAMTVVSSNPNKPFVEHSVQLRYHQAKGVAASASSSSSSNELKRKPDISNIKKQKFCLRCHNVGHDIGDCYAKKTK